MDEPANPYARQMCGHMIRYIYRAHDGTQFCIICAYLGLQQMYQEEHDQRIRLEERLKACMGALNIERDTED